MALRIVPMSLHTDLYDPAQHAPKYHEHSLLRHLELVCQAAERIKDATGVDVRLAAALHDTAKVAMFARVARGANEAMVRGTLARYKFHYIGHERDSAGIAYDKGADEETCWLVANHDVSWRGDITTPEKFIALCNGNAEVAAKLVALCAADAAGKGWTEFQREERIKLAELFAGVARLAMMSPTAAVVIDNALRRW